MFTRPARSRLSTAVTVLAILAAPPILSTLSRQPAATATPQTILLGGHGPRLDDESRSALTFRLQAPTFHRAPESQEGTAVERIRAAGTDGLFDEGVPDIPVFRRILAIPECEEFSVEVTIHSESLISGIDVPVTPTLGADHASGIFSRPTYPKRPDIYGRDAYFPDKPLTIERTGTMRGQRLAVVVFSPWQYNPVTRELRVVEDATVEVLFDGVRSGSHTYAGPLNDVIESIAMNGVGGTKPGLPSGPMLTSGGGEVCWASGQTWQAAASSVKSCGADYLIIAAEELNDSSLIDSLAYHRADYNGFNVAIVKMGQIDSSPDIDTTPLTIRTFIKDIYDSGTAAHMGDGHLGYVLLLGDAYNPAGDILIPSYYGYCAGAPITDNSCASDAYYSFMEDPATDRFADILVGRLPVDFDSTYWELRNVVNKTKDYEPLTTASWADSILLVSGVSDQGFSFAGEGLGGFEAYFDSVESLAPIPGKYYSQMHRLAEPDSLVFSNTVADRISDGQWITSLFDHGHLYELWRAFYPQSYEGLQNVSRPTVAYSLACNTGFFDLTYQIAQNWEGSGTCCTGTQFSHPNCYAESTDLDSCDVMIERLVNQTHGAVAAYAYSREEITLTGEKTFLAFFRALGEHSASTLGEILIATRLLFPNSISETNLMLFGDPALNIGWQAGDEQKTSDLATGPAEFLTGPYLSAGASANVEVVVRNLWKGAAADVRVHLWEGSPFTAGSTLLDSCTIDTLHAYTDTTLSLTTGQIGGETKLCVIVDPYDTIDEASENNNTGCKTVYAARYLSGFPIELERTARHEITVAEIHPAIGKELLVVDLEELTCFSTSTGDELWDFDRGARDPAHSPIVSHAYKDKRPTVTIEFFDAPFSSTERTYTLGGSDGSVLDSLTLGEGRAMPPTGGQRFALADIGVDDGSLELVTTVYRDLATDSLFLIAVAPDGTVRSDYAIHPASGFAPYPHLAVADIDLDGAIEIVALATWPEAYDQNELKIVRHDSQGFSLVGEINLEEKAGPVLSLVDVEHDGYMEILYSGSSGTTSTIHLVDTTWTGPAKWSTGVTSTHFAAVGDLDGDNDDEIVVAEKNQVRILSLETGYPSDTRSYSGSPLCEPLLGDLDGDGDDDIVVTYFDQPDPYLYPGYYRVYMLVLDESLSPIDSTIVFAPAKRGNTNIGLPALADVDDNGIMDIAFASGDGYLHVFEVGTSAGQASWPARYANNAHTRTSMEYISGSYENLSISQRTRMIGDVTIDSLGCLFVGAGAEVAIDTSSSDPLAFTVRGKARMVTSDNTPVVFAPRYDGGTWEGFYFGGSSSSIDTLIGVRIQDAWNGIEHDTPIHLDGVEIVDASGTAILSNADVTIVDSSILSGTGRGIYAGNDVNATVLGTVVDGLEGVGLTCEGCSLKVDLESRFTDNGSHGILLDGTGANQSSIEASVIVDNAADGIRCEGSSPYIVGCTIHGNASGVSAWYNSGPSVSYSSIKSNTIGVTAAQNSYPFLGSTGSPGHNCFAQNSSYHVSNVSDPGTPIYTIGEHWENRCCPAKFLYGNIVCGSCDATEQCSGPSPAAPEASESPGTDLNSGIPRRFALQAPYPNPFNPTATVRIAIPTPGPVSVRIYNVRGQLVSVLYDGRVEAGYHTLHWTGTDRRGTQVASGVYFLRMVAPGFKATRKMVMLK